MWLTGGRCNVLEVAVVVEDDRTVMLGHGGGQKVDDARGSVVTARIVGPVSTGFVSAAHLGWLIMTGTGVALFVIGLVTTGKWALRTAQVFDEEKPHDVPVAPGAVAVRSR